MKKTFSHTGDRFELTSHTWVALILLFAFSIGVALLARAVTLRNIEATQQTEFTQQHSFRVEQLRGIVRAKTTVLESVAALLPLAQTLDQDKFSEYVRPIIQNAETNFICWHDFDADQLFREPRDAAGCDEFVLFRTTTPLTESSTAFLFSLAAGGLDTPRSGFVSIKLDLGAIQSSPGDDQHAEYLYIRDRNALTLDRFLITPDGLSETTVPQEPSLNHIANVIYFDDIELIYDIHFVPSTSTLPWLIALAVLLANLLVGGVLLFYWWRSRILGHHVRQRTEELEQFVYRAAHDLKSPLTGIRQLSAFVQDDINAGDYNAVADNVSRIEAQSKSLEAMLSGIYDLSTNNNNASHSPEYNISDAVDATLLRHSEGLSQGNIAVQWNPDVLCVTTLPRARIEQILDNLVSNAIKYANTSVDCQSTVVISAKKHNGLLVITVSDNGIGISDEFFKQPRIQLFKRYRPDMAEGSGVGLSITTRHVFHLKGNICFEQLDPGTRVKVSIPD